MGVNALPAVMDMPLAFGLELESWLAARLAGGLAGRRAQAGSWRRFAARQPFFLAGFEGLASVL